MQKFCEILGFLQKKSAVFAKIADFLQNFANFSKNQLDSFVDLEKPEKMRIWSQNFVSIQPRTSPLKFAASRAGIAPVAGGPDPRVVLDHHAEVAPPQQLHEVLAERGPPGQKLRILRNYLKTHVEKQEPIENNIQNIRNVKYH